PEARFQLMTLRLGIGVARAYLNWVDSVLRDLGKG
ncbi:MAG: hypothetical protein ACXVP8_08965, partial [Actinomycetota bacterium]